MPSRPSPSALARQWLQGVGRGFTYPDGRVQVGHSHLLRSLHSLDHLLLVLWGEQSGAGAGPCLSPSPKGALHTRPGPEGSPTS